MRQRVLTGLLLFGGLLVWTGAACSGVGPVSRDEAVRQEADAFGHYMEGWLRVLDARGLDREGKTEEAGKVWLEGDFTGDGAVDVMDLAMMANYYGQATGAADGAPVPGPQVTGVLVLGLLGVVRRRTKRTSR